MTLRRRELLGVTGSVALAGCLSGVPLIGSTPDTSFGGNVTSDEPLVTDVDLSIREPYPNHYSAVISSETEASERIRWEYIESELPMLIDPLEDAVYDSERQFFFGMVLPERKRLRVDDVSSRRGTIEYTYRIRDRHSGSSELGINTNISRVRTDTTDVQFTVEF